MGRKIINAITIHHHYIDDVHYEGNVLAKTLKLARQIP
jgi:hypothetical protein